MWSESAAILSTLVVVVWSQYGEPAAATTTYRDEPPKYAYQYAVKDDYFGVDFSADERREADNTVGSYKVLLPDGRVQTVVYKVNGEQSGYVADVSYNGEPVYKPPQPYSPSGPAPQSAQSYSPSGSVQAPVQSYNPAPAPVQSSQSYNPAPAPVRSSQSYNPAPAQSYSPALSYRPLTSTLPPATEPLVTPAPQAYPNSPQPAALLTFSAAPSYKSKIVFKEPQSNPQAESQSYTLGSSSNLAASEDVKLEEPRAPKNFDTNEPINTLFTDNSNLEDFVIAPDPLEAIQDPEARANNEDDDIVFDTELSIDEFENIRLGSGPSIVEEPATVESIQIGAESSTIQLGNLQVSEQQPANADIDQIKVFSIASSTTSPPTVSTPSTFSIPSTTVTVLPPAVPSTPSSSSSTSSQDSIFSTVVDLTAASSGNSKRFARLTSGSSFQVSPVYTSVSRSLKLSSPEIIYGQWNPMR